MPHSTPSKTCSKCRAAKPLEDFNKSSKSPDGFQYYCRPCVKLRRSVDVERRRERDRLRYPAVKEAANAKSAAWRAENAAHIKEYRKRYRQSNGEALGAYERQYRSANAEKLRGYAREKARHWRANNPDKARVKDARRRAMKLEAFVEPVDVRIVAARDGGQCFVCGQTIDPTLRHPHLMSMTLEHVIPLARGGEHSYANCSISHLSCNASKGARV